MKDLRMKQTRESNVRKNMMMKISSKLTKRPLLSTLFKLTATKGRDVPSEVKDEEYQGSSNTDHKKETSPTKGTLNPFKDETKLDENNRFDQKMLGRFHQAKMSYTSIKNAKKDT